MTHELEVALDMIPEYRREEMRRYINDGLRPGDFLYAVLSNDLFRARFYATGPSWMLIDSYITFLVQHAPPNCFGSRAKLEAWIEDAAEWRRMAQPTPDMQP